MDPLSALRAELEKKRKANSQFYKAENNNSGGSSAKRWRSAADLEKERREKYLQEEREREKQAAEKRRRKQQLYVSDVQNSKEEIKKDSTIQKDSERKSEDNTNAGSKQDDDIIQLKEPPLSKKEVIRRLRTRKQPATLFGETAWDRFERLRLLQLTTEEKSEGQRNVFQKKLREMEQKDQKDDELHFSGAQMPHLRKNVENDEDKEEEEVLRKDASKEDYVHSQIRKYVRLWRSEIDNMSKEERRTRKGRTQAVTYEQTKEWLQPLEIYLKKKKLERSVLNGIVEIFEAVAQKEYVLANRLYLEKLAIGNAPWPMGATMVGIHARAAREKIGEDKIAHVMNDEQTRKYIQAVKRLIGVAQRHFPTVLSKMVM